MFLPTYKAGVKILLPTVRQYLVLPPHFSPKISEHFEKDNIKELPSFTDWTQKTEVKSVSHIKSVNSIKLGTEPAAPLDHTGFHLLAIIFNCLYYALQM